MLVALQSGERVEADGVERGGEFRCPGCRGRVIVKKGRKVIHHFAHESRSECDWDAGETYAHRQSKKVLRDAFVSRDVRAELELTLTTPLGTRRADVVAWGSDRTAVAFELQHIAIGLDELEGRANSYARARIPQIWIPFLRPLIWERAEKQQNGALLVAEYPARPFERWIHGFNLKRGMWMYDPASETIWRGSLSDHYRWVDGATWYEDGEEQYRESFQKKSVRWKELTLEGPYDPAELRVSLFTRKAHSVPGYNWPAGRVAQFVVPEE